MIAVLLVAAAFGGQPAVAAQEYRIVRVVHYGRHAHKHKTRRACRRHTERRCRRHVHRRRVPIPAPAPSAPSPSPSPAPTPAPGPALPSRTSVDLTDDVGGWAVTPAYRELAAGEIEFNANNLGEDDHDFSVRDAGGAVLANEAVLVGETVTVRLTLAPAFYTLYCSITDHETRGMRASITVR